MGTSMREAKCQRRLRVAEETEATQQQHKIIIIIESKELGRVNRKRWSGDLKIKKLKKLKEILI